MLNGLRITVLITSDRIANGEAEDQTVPALKQALEFYQAECAATAIVPDDAPTIEETLRLWAKRTDVDVILTSGGTGITSRDVTVEATKNLIAKELPGMGEEMRRRSLEKTPFALLSRATAGIIGQTVVVNLPGSPKGAVECLTFIGQALAHAVALARGESVH